MLNLQNNFSQDLQHPNTLWNLGPGKLNWHSVDKPKFRKLETCDLQHRKVITGPRLFACFPHLPGALEGSIFVYMLHDVSQFGPSKIKCYQFLRNVWGRTNIPILHYHFRLFLKHSVKDTQHPWLEFPSRSSNSNRNMAREKVWHLDQYIFNDGKCPGAKPRVLFYNWPFQKHLENSNVCNFLIYSIVFVPPPALLGETFIWTFYNSVRNGPGLL